MPDSGSADGHFRVLEFAHLAIVSRIRHNALMRQRINTLVEVFHIEASTAIDSHTFTGDEAAPANNYSLHGGVLAGGVVTP